MNHSMVKTTFFNQFTADADDFVKVVINLFGVCDGKLNAILRNCVGIIAYILCWTLDLRSIKIVNNILNSTIVTVGFGGANFINNAIGYIF